MPTIFAPVDFEQFLLSSVKWRNLLNSIIHDGNLIHDGTQIAGRATKKCL